MLETAGEFWAWKKIEGFYSISNGLTLEDNYDAIHPNAIDFAYQNGWIKRENRFRFEPRFPIPFYFFQQV